MSAEDRRPSPDAILADRSLSREQKIAKLRQMAYDAREMQVATEEGMGGSETPDVGRIRAALRELGVDDGDTVTDAKQ